MSMPAGRVVPLRQYDRDRAAIMAICQRFRLRREDRLEVACVLLDRNVNSYNDLSHVEMRRLRDAFEGAALVCMIQVERKTGERR